MRFREGINLEKLSLSPKDDKIVTAILDSLPIFIQVTNFENTLVNEDNPAILQILMDKMKGNNHFVLQPKKGFKIGWFLDDYLIRENGYEIRNIFGDAGNRIDPRPSLSFHKNIDNWNYTLSIYLIPEIE